MILLKHFAIALLFTVGLARWAAADSIDELAARIKANEAYLRAHPETVTEAQKAQHNAEMLKEMKRLDDEVKADRAAEMPLNRVWAEAEAKRWQPKAEPVADKVIIDPSDGVTREYDNKK